MKKNCAHCRKEFEAKRSNTKYCKRGCSTMACNKRRGFKIGRIRMEEKDNGVGEENPPQVALQKMNAIDNARAKDELTLVGILEGFIGAGAASFMTQSLTSGEYDDRIAHLQKTLNQILYELQKQNGDQKSISKVSKGMSNSKMSQQKGGMPIMVFPIEPMI